MKKKILILVILVLAGLTAFRTAQNLAAKKEEPKARGIGAIPRVEVVPVTLGLIEERIMRNGDIAPAAQVTIYSKVRGWVDQSHVQEGNLVKQDQEIVTLGAFLLAMVFVPTLYTRFEVRFKPQRRTSKPLAGG
jgi:multidrug efflux pump subunit AcrA (membrane-fusion protein)